MDELRRAIEKLPEANQAGDETWSRVLRRDVLALIDGRCQFLFPGGNGAKCQAQRGHPIHSGINDGPDIAHDFLAARSEPGAEELCECGHPEDIHYWTCDTCHHIPPYAATPAADSRCWKCAYGTFGPDHKHEPAADSRELDVLRPLLEKLRDRGYQPQYNGRPSCPFCSAFIDYEMTHYQGCILVAALTDPEPAS